MTEVLVIGASGLLGQHLLNEAEARRYSVTGTYYSEEVAGLVRLDLTDFEAVKTMIAERRPDIVILPAAMTSIAECESNPMRAMQVNSEAPLVVAKACRSIGAKMALFSTVHVFNCESGPYAEDSKTNPVNILGRTRLEGENNVMEALPDSLAIRTCEDFGWNRLRPRENEVTSIVHRIRCGEEVDLAVDQWATPSYAPKVAEHMFDLLRNDESGIFHIATSSRLTRYEMGKRVCEAFGLDEERLEPTSLGNLGLGASLPHRLCLSTTKIEAKLGVPMNSFESCLEEMRIRH